MEKKAKNNEKKIIRRRTRLLKQEDMQIMRDMGLEDVLEKVSHIDTRDGIGLISAILLNAFMQKERQMYLKPKLSDSFLLTLYQEGIEGCVPLDALLFTHPLPLFLEGKTTSPDRWH
jgi:hypothetical protein